MHPPRVPPVVKRVSGSFWASCNHAFTGILYATRSQRNMRIHLFVAALVLVATLYLRLERAYVALLVVAIVLVIGSELINTAIEAVVDLLTVVHHPLAKVAKDAAAGAVLVASAGAAIIGYLAFYEGVTAAGARVGSAVASLPRNFVIVAIVLTGIGTIFAKAYAGRHGQPLRGGAISGHSAVAFSGATALALLTHDLLLGAIAYFLALLVAHSRVEGGIHSWGETIFGAAIGSALTTLAFFAIQAWQAPRPSLPGVL